MLGCKAWTADAGNTSGSHSLLGHRAQDLSGPDIRFLHGVGVLHNHFAGLMAK